MGAAARACGFPGARGGLGPARSRSPPLPQAKFGGRGMLPARARVPQLFTGPVGKKKPDTPVVAEGGRRQEWLLSLILVYSEKLQTGRV